MVRTNRCLDKGGAIVDSQAEVIVMEQGETGGSEHTGVTWDQRSDGGGGGGNVQLWILMPASECTDLKIS